MVVYVQTAWCLSKYTFKEPLALPGIYDLKLLSVGRINNMNYYYFLNSLQTRQQRPSSEQLRLLDLSPSPTSKSRSTPTSFSLMSPSAKTRYAFHEFVEASLSTGGVQTTPAWSTFLKPVPPPRINIRHLDLEGLNRHS